MSETILNGLNFTDADCLEFERSKSEKLQYFLVNSIKTINDLEDQLKESRVETIAARNEVSYLKLEIETNKRKFSYQQAPSSSSSPSSSSPAPKNNMLRHNNESPSMPKQIQRQKTVPTSTSTSPAAFFTRMMPFSSRVEKAIDSVATSLVNPHIDIPPKNFVFKFVCRIFDGGDLYYGYLVAYDRQHFQVILSILHLMWHQISSMHYCTYFWSVWYFWSTFVLSTICIFHSKNDLFFWIFHPQVVYNDGDTQRLSLREVRLSLVEEVQVPLNIALDCKMHYEKGSYLTRVPLPTISWPCRFIVSYLY